MGFICKTLRFLYYDMEIFITIWKSLLRYGWGEVTHLLGESRVFSRGVIGKTLRFFYYDMEICITIWNFDYEVISLVDLVISPSCFF